MKNRKKKQRYPLTAQLQGELEVRYVYAFWLELVCCLWRCCARSPGRNLYPVCSRDLDPAERSLVKTPPANKSTEILLLFILSFYFVFKHFDEWIWHESVTLGCLVVTFSRATALSSFLSSSSLMYILYSSWRCGGTSRLCSETHRDTWS